MRIILILLIVAAALALWRSHQNNCTFGEAGWFDCVLGRSATTTPTTTPTPPAETPAPAEQPSPQP
jgi:hypothetical protein